MPATLTDVTQLPVVTKAEMMSHFDQWLTDPTVNRKQVEAFIADPAHLGDDYLDRYVVCTTSGSTGTPAILLHDHGALTIYNVLGYVPFVACRVLVARSVRLATWERQTGSGFRHGRTLSRQHHDGPACAYYALAGRDAAAVLRTFSPPRVGRGPQCLPACGAGGYPSALESLAKKQQAGQLHIHPVLVNAAGETLTAAARQQIEADFGCRVGNYYGSSEAVGLTYECAAQRLHVNSDWYILEPVDEHDRRVPPGELSHDVLVTNLANRIQPIIRYRMGDRVAIGPETCSCGGPFPPDSCRRPYR